MPATFKTKNNKTTSKSLDTDELIENLKNGIYEFKNSLKFKEYLDSINKFHNYSSRNVALILFQLPNASLVASYGTWKNKFDRNVKKGEKSIRILAPIVKKIYEDDDRFDELSEIYEDQISKDENGKYIKNIIGFKAVSVFDVSQTEGKELPKLVDDLKGKVDNYSKLIQSIIKFSRAKIFFDKEWDIDSRGYFNRITDEIHINDNLEEMQKVKTLIHELAHSYLHFRDDGLWIEQKETEAESVAYVVCNKLGINTEDYSFPYVANFISKIENYQEFFDFINSRIRKTSDLIFDNIERNMFSKEDISKVEDSIRQEFIDIENAKEAEDAEDQTIESEYVL